MELMPHFKYGRLGWHLEYRMAQKFVQNQLEMMCSATLEEFHSNKFDDFQNGDCSGHFEKSDDHYFHLE